MNEQIPGTIVFVSAFYNRTGLAGGARVWAKSLHEAGLKVRIVSVNDVQPGIDDCDLALLKQLEQTPVTPPVTAIFFHNPSETWFQMQLPEPYLRIIMTGFVGENVPPDWVDICNRMDRVCVQSEAERAAFVASGLPPERVHVAPASHSWLYLPIVPIPVPEDPARPFRFLSMGTFSPNRRWDTLIEAFLAEFRDDNRAELYLRVNYPTWHPIPGQPRRDLTELIESLRQKTGSSARIIVDEALGTRMEIARLMDSCDAYVSLDAAVASPLAEAIFRSRLVVAAADIWSADNNRQDDSLALRPEHAILVPADGDERVVVDGDMLQYLPPYKGVSWPKLRVEMVRAALRRAIDLPPEERRRMARAANRRYSEGRAPDKFAARLVDIIRAAWAAKRGEAADNPPAVEAIDYRLDDTEALEAAYRQSPHNKTAALALAKHALRHDDFARAGDIIAQALQAAPNDADWLILKGNLAIEQQNFEQAFDIFEQVRAIAPQTIGLDIALEQLAALTGNRPVQAAQSTGRRPHMTAGSIYTRHLMADAITRHGFEIGEFTYGQPVIRWWGEDVKLKIGRYCSIADNVKIYLGGNHRHNWVTTYPFPSPPMNQDWPNANHRGLPTLPESKGDVVIGHDVWIGDDAVILSGVTVGHGAVIAARTVVTKDVPPFAIVGGNPGKVIGYRFSDNEIAMLLELQWWNWDPVQVNRFMPYLCAESVTDFYRVAKQAMAADDDVSEGYQDGELFTGERAMPLASNMDEQVMREHWARYTYVAPLVAGKRVLDVACGAGYGSDLLAQTAQSVVGGDISPQTVAYSQQHYPRENLTFQTMDIRDIPYPDRSFDMVVSFETIEHIVEGEQFLSEIVRLLDDDGTLVISTPLGGPVGNPHHVAYYQQGTFSHFLRRFFDDVQVLYQRDDKFFAESYSPERAPTFTGEYALAICQKPRRRKTGLTSIIILTHNQLEHTERCLDSIARHTPQPHEIIVVDNASTDGTLDYLRRYRAEHPHVRVIANAENLGFAAGNNQGLALAQGDNVVLLNNDTVVTEGWLAAMQAVLEQHPDVGLVGPVTNRISGPQQIDVTYTALDDMPAFAADWVAAHAGQSTEFPRVVGFCLLARRAVIDRLGGLDERYGSGNFEDDDFCMRAAGMGFKVRIAHDAFVHHAGSQTFIGAGIDYGDSLHKNWALFCEKWGIAAGTPYGQNYPSMVRFPADTSRHYLPLPEPDTVTALEVHPSATALLVAVPDDQPSADLEAFLGHLAAVIEPDSVVVNVAAPGLPELPPADLPLTHLKLPPTEALAALMASRMETVILLSADVTLFAETLPALMAVAQADPTIAAVGPVSNAAQAAQQVALSADNPAAMAANRLAEFGEQWQETLYLGGFCLLLKTHPLRVVGGVNGSLPPGDALLDAFGRLKAMGFKRAVALGAWVHHQQLSRDEGAYFDELFRQQQALAEWLAPGQAALQANDFEAAAREFAAAAEAHPAEAALHAALGNTRLALGQPAKAADAFRRAADLLPHDVGLRNRLGKALFQAGQPEQAEIAFRQAREAAPDDIDTILNLADLYRAGQKYRRAMELLREALRLAPENVDVLVASGLLMLDMDDVEAAEMAWQSIAEADRGHPGAVALMHGLAANGSAAVGLADWLSQADQLQAAEKWAQAAGLLRDTLARQSDRLTATEQAELWNRLGVCHFRQGHLAEAESAFVTGLDLAGDDAAALNNLAELYLGQEQFDRATEIINRALRVDPNDTGTLMLLGTAAIQLGDLDTAQLAFRKVQTLAPDTAGIDQLLAELSAAPAPAPEAATIDIDAIFAQADAAMSDGDWQAAIDALQPALDIDTLPAETRAALFNRLGVANFQAGQLPQAGQAFSAVLEQSPDDLTALTNLATLFLQQEQYDQGTEYLNRALAVNPDDVNLLMMLGNVAVQLEAFDVALMAFQKVRALAPDTEGIADVVRQLEGMPPT